MVALDYSIAVAEYGMTLMERALEPGVTENQLFALLHQTNIAHDGDWIDGRMLCSGPEPIPGIRRRVIARSSRATWSRSTPT